ncbi:MAG: hypothetical protein WCX65_08935 [bacterium]
MDSTIRRWDRDSLIKEIKSRSHPGNSIRFEPDRDDTGFEDAIYSEFGGWENVLAEAGLNPKMKLLNYWTKEEVVKRLRQIAERDEPLNTLFLETNHPRLWNAARRLFNNIEKAVEAAGFEYDKIKKRYSWDEGEIKKRIKDMYEKGEDITQIAMMGKDSKLLAAGQKFYGSWSRAVESAGIDYSAAKQRHRLQKFTLGRTDKKEKKKEIYFMRAGRLVRMDQ